MGGKHCCVVRCTNSNSKTKKYTADRLEKISYVSFPPNTPENSEWRSRLIGSISRADKGFNPDKKHICTEHFDKKKDLLFHGRGYTLVKGALPTLNMPQKSVQIHHTSRNPPKERPPPEVPQRVLYYDLQDVKKDVGKGTSGWVVLQSSEDILILGRYEHAAREISRQIAVNADLDVKVTFGDVALKQHWSLENTPIHKFLGEVDGWKKCPGITDPLLQDICINQAYKFITTKVVDGKPTISSILRAKLCEGTLQDSSTSALCTRCQKSKTQLLEKSEASQQNRIHPNTPLATLSRSELVVQVKESRSHAKQLQNAVKKLRDELGCQGVYVANAVSDGLVSAIEDHITENANPFMSLFWTEQKKAFSRTPKGIRWHPMLIRFAIYLHYQSPRAYKALRETGVLKLPNESTLRDYTNVIQPRPGFQPHVFLDLKKQADGLPPEKRYVALLHDEMSIRSDLVYDRRGGEVIGFVNPETWTFNENVDESIATQVLVFMVIGINNPIKISIGHIATRSATSAELFPLLWTAIAYLEMSSELKVISSTSDKATPNQRLYRLHRVDNESVVYKALNHFAPDQGRYIYFFSDAPHLMKTIRNNVSKSKPGGTRYLWNQGKEILWSHVSRVYSDDANRQLYRTKLTNDHIHLTPSSTMSVRLAVQVLSRTVSQVMATYYSPDMDETSRFFQLCDRFFDCLNVRSMNEAVHRRKPDLAPYRNINDPRFTFLEDEFLKYLQDWLDSTQQRPGFTKAERSKMFLSYQTYEGIVMTVKAFTAATRYLLQNGVTHVLSQDYCQDPIEEHFGRHRGLGRRNDNPTVHQFGYQENQLRLQRGLAFTFNPKGNTAGRNGQKRPVPISNSPLKKIKRH